MKKRNPALFTGLIGFSLQFVLNLLGIFAFHKASAVFFSEQWWSSWFPGWAVFMVFVVVGIGRLRRSDGEAIMPIDKL